MILILTDDVDEDAGVMVELMHMRFE